MKNKKEFNYSLLFLRNSMSFFFVVVEKGIINISAYKTNKYSFDVF